MKRFFAWITALLMLLSLAACSSTQTSTAAASQQASTSETGKSENELIAEENDILAANNALWEKVFASMDKNVTDTTLSSNYGDILMSALDHAKDQPAFAFLVSVCTAAGLLAIVVRQVQPLLDWLRTLDGYFQGQSPAVLLQVLGIALVAQLAADTCKEAGLSAAATAIELCGRVLALLQALPLLQSLLGSFAAYLQ